MNKYSICIVDDKIPAAGKMDDTVRLNSNNLKYLKNEVRNWGDPQVKEFIENLLNSSDWTLSGFTNPNILINCLEEELYRPDIVIFDWDYSVFKIGGDDVEQSLLSILQQSFSIVFIFTGVDKQEEIEAVLNQPDFAKFKNRFKIKNKSDENSTESLCAEIEKMSKENFSFKFGAEIRKKSLEAVERILIELGKVSLEQTVEYFKLSDNTNKDLVDFIAERFKNHLTASPFKELPGKGKDDGKSNREIARQLWSYRLYFYHGENDVLVRKGDIIKKDDEFFVVVTADCDLARFWHKNYGYLNLLPMHEIKEGAGDIKKVVTMTRKEKDLIGGAKVNSFSSDMGSLPGVLILPFLKCNNKKNENEFKDFALFPKELRNEKVEIPNPHDGSNLKDKSLQYGEGFGFQRIATISEPFLTPFIQHIFSTISGYGTPDYPKVVSDLISKNFEKIFA